MPPNCHGFTYTARLTTVGAEIYDDQDTADGNYRDDEAAESKCCPELHPLSVQKLDSGEVLVSPPDEEQYYHCDVCQKCLNDGPEFHGCRTCDYDICADCLIADDTASKAQWAEALAQEAADEVRRCFLPMP